MQMLRCIAGLQASVCVWEGGIWNRFRALSRARKGRGGEEEEEIGDSRTFPH